MKMYKYPAMGKLVIATRLPDVIKEFGTSNKVPYVERPQRILGKTLKVISADAIMRVRKKRDNLLAKIIGVPFDQLEEVQLGFMQRRGPVMGRSVDATSLAYNGKGTSNVLVTSSPKGGPLQKSDY